MANQKQVSRRKEVSGVVFVGCLMLGFAVGFFTGNIVAGMFGGLGVGFVAMSIVMAGEERESRIKGSSGLAFVGCLMLGFAVGFFTGNLVAGLFGGLGVGFVAMAIVRYTTGEW